MTESFSVGVGAVLSADIAVSDHQKVIEFYSRVLSTGTNPLWREDDLMNNLGMPIIGIGERTEDYEHLPLQWMPHIQVANVGKSVQRALDLGGSVLLNSQNEEGESQWAVLSDPSGAAFGIVPALSADEVAQSGDGAASKPPKHIGRISWLDLTVPDATTIHDFYQQVVGWPGEPVNVQDDDEHYTDYNMLGEDGNPAAGICHARAANEGLPPVWMIYLPVDDIEASLQRVQEEGGKVIKSMLGENGGCAYAALQDPAGACFALVPAN